MKIILCDDILELIGNEVEKFRNRLRDSAPYEKRLADD